MVFSIAGEPCGACEQLARLEERRQEVERRISAAEAKDGAEMIRAVCWSSLTGLSVEVGV